LSAICNDDDDDEEDGEERQGNGISISKDKGGKDGRREYGGHFVPAVC